MKDSRQTRKGGECTCPSRMRLGVGEAWTALDLNCASDATASESDQGKHAAPTGTVAQLPARYLLFDVELCSKYLIYLLSFSLH